MPGISFGGISSGLDTKSIVDQLISVERNPQVLLQNKVVAERQTTSALQGLNSRLASLATSAAALAKPEAFTKTAATSSDESVSVVSKADATNASLTFSVAQIATRSSWASGEVANGSFGPQNVTIDVPGGDPVQVVATGGSVQALADAINAKNGGVRATTVRTGDGTYRLLVTSTNTGEKNEITNVSFENADPGETLEPLSAQQTARGKDASINLGGGTYVSSPSNTFTDLITGVDVTVSKTTVSGSQVTITSVPDKKAVAAQVSGVVDSLNVTLSELAAQGRADKDSRGALAGSSLVRNLQQQLASTLSTVAPGASMADLGIELTRQGTVTIDSAKFSAFATANPALAQQLTGSFATAVAGVAKAASDSTSGTISLAVTASQSAVKDLTERISGWDVRLAARREALERQFTALEVALDRSKSLSGALTSQLSQLSSSYR